MYNVEIINFKETQIAVLEHYGSPKDLDNTVNNFIEWRKETGLSPVHTSRTFGIVYNNPETTPENDFRFDVCGEIFQDLDLNDFGIVQKSIPQGNCAVLRHFGSIDNIVAKIYYLFNDWLPKSNEELRSFPLFFQYLNFASEVKEDELITDILLPIK